MNRRVAAEDDTREWQLVGTMSPRLINTQPATPRPVTTTRYAFRDDRESLRFRGLLPPQGRGGIITRGEDSSRFEKMDDPSILRVLCTLRVFISADNITVHRTGTTLRNNVVLPREKGDRFAVCAKFTRLLFFFLSLSSFFPLDGHNNTKAVRDDSVVKHAARDKSAFSLSARAIIFFLLSHPSTCRAPLKYR